MSVSMKSELSNMSREPSSMAFRGMGSGDTYVGERKKRWSGGRRKGVEEGEKEGRKERRRGGKRREKGGKEVRNIAKPGGTPPPTSQRSRNLLKNTNAMFSQSTAWCEEQEK